MENHAENVHGKLVPDPFYFGKQPKTAIACKNFLRIIYFKRELWKAFKKVSFILNPVPFNGQSYKKQKVWCSQKSKPRFNWEKARFNRDDYNFNGINWDLSEILS